MKEVRRTSPFLKQFEGPGENSIVCFRFWQAVVASGCPGECAYCFLQTQTPYRRGLYDLMGTIFSNIEDMRSETERWLKQRLATGLIVGENQDGLAFERHYKKLVGVTPLEILLPLFRDKNPHGHTLVVLSKFTTTEYADAIGPVSNAVFSWSLSLPSISAKYERRVASLRARLMTARRMKEEGWRVRFRLDALAPIENWRREVREIVDEINDIGPEMLTIGALRASNLARLRGASEANGRDASIFDFLGEKDPSGFKYRVGHQDHVGLFSEVIESLDPRIKLGLCKEDASIWEELGLQWQGCHCLHGATDIVVSERGIPPQLRPHSVEDC